MYIGSVRFFRHLILGSFFALILLLVAMIILFFVKNKGINESGNADKMEVIPNKKPEKQEKVDAYHPEKFQQLTTNGNKVVFLTFNDGPSENTSAILDILRNNGVPATFFVVGSEVEKYPDTIKRIVSQGNGLGIHSDTHDYEKIYASVDSFLADANNCLEKIKAITKYPVSAIRLPGGSKNDYNEEISEKITKELTKRGYQYFDWNIGLEDVNGESVAGPAISISSNIFDNHLSSQKLIERQLAIPASKNKTIAQVNEQSDEDTTVHPDENAIRPDGTVPPDENAERSEESNDSPPSGVTDDSSVNDFDDTISDDTLNDPSLMEEEISLDVMNTIASTPDEYFKNLTTQLGNKDNCVILMYDGPGQTLAVESLDKVIKYLLKNGYTFDVLSNRINPIHFNE